MAKVLFNQNIDLCGFNIGNVDTSDSNDGITYPSNQNDNDIIEMSTKNSLLFSFVNNDMYRDHYLYAKYKSKALSGDRFILYRQSVRDRAKKYMATISGVTNGFFDYNVGNNEQYKYIVETNPADIQNSDAQEMSVTLETSSFINPHWNYWSICDIEKNLSVSRESGVDIYVPSDTMFIMKNNIQAGSINDNLNIVQYNTLGKYGHVIQNSQKYDSSNISCLIDDFMVVQNMKNINHVIIKDDILSAKERDEFLLSIDDSEKYYDFCFIFPKIDNTYYSYQPNNSKLIYKKLSVTPTDNQWFDSYFNYYEYNQTTHQYVPLQASYTQVPQGKPDDWDNENQGYLQYYIKDDNGRYIQNNSKDYQESVQYYKYEIPKFEENYYYQLTVNSWLPSASQYVICNNIEKVNAWRECLSNGKLKLLKAPNGQKWVVKINEQNTLEVVWDSFQRPTTISLNWQEVIDINKISIIKW